MSASSDYFIQQQEDICGRFAAGDLERQEALQMLVRMGFDPHEARDLLNEAEA
jgi:hypothetical protein